MFRRRIRRGVPPLNTTSTADISFMLLIFFLVTTSMGADKGLRRQLPSLNQQEQPAVTVSEGDVMHVAVKADGKVVCEEQAVEMSRLKATFKAFIAGKGAKHTFQLACDREAPYETYYGVQNALQSAYRELRNERAQSAYGRYYDQLTDAQKLSVDKAVPQRIAESYDMAVTTGGAGDESAETGKEERP